MIIDNPLLYKILLVLNILLIKTINTVYIEYNRIINIIYKILIDIIFINVDKNLYIYHLRYFSFLYK